MAYTEFLVTLVGGFIGGAMIVTSGGGSFVTYPLLLSLGHTAINANATSTVGLWPAGLASIPGYGHEIKSQRKLIKILLIPAFLGAVLGSYVLTQTTENVFGLVAPVLIFTGSLVLQFRKAIVRFSVHIRIRTEKRRLVVVSITTFFVASYSSFFGAGVGILMLGCLSILGVDHLVHNIAIKNVLVILANGVAVVYFIFAGLVHFDVAFALACGSIPGGIFGSRIIHLISENSVRRFTVIFGIVTSLILLIAELGS